MKSIVDVSLRVLLLSSGALIVASNACADLAKSVTTIAMPNEAQSIDGNGVDLLYGISRPGAAQLSIGSGEALLQRSFQYNYDARRDNFFGKMYKETFSYDDRSTTAVDTSIVNTCPYYRDASNQGINCPRIDAYYSITSAPPGSDYPLYVLTDSDGTKVIYDGRHRIVYPDGYQQQGYIVEKKHPNGEVVNYYYNGLYPRLQFVKSNYGYGLKYEYYDSEDVESPSMRLKKITAINLAVDYCDPNAASCTYSVPWESWTYNSAVSDFGINVPEGVAWTNFETATNALGGSYTFAFNQMQFPSGRTITRNQIGGTYHEVVQGGGTYEECEWQEIYDGPFDTSPRWDVVCWEVPLDDGGESNGVCVRYDAKFCLDGNFTITRGGNTWNYNFDSSVNTFGAGTSDYAIMTIVDPMGKTKTVRSMNVGIQDSVDNYNIIRRITSVTDESGQTTSYEYEGIYGKLKSITYPEGNKTVLIYDTRGNLTERRDLSKPNSGLANSVWTTGYPETCSSSITCNKPIWARDARGNLPENINNTAYRTDFEYYPEHGGVKLVRLPPDAAGVRQETHYTYEAKYAQVKNSSGNLVNAAGPIYKLVKITTCATAATCANSANERVTEYAYNHPNLLLTSETVRAGDSSVSATTTYAYDYVGNVVSVNGPRTDVDDTSYVTYDALRRKVLEISADPDGSGGLKRQVVKHEYDLDSLETRTESATCRDVTFTNGVPTGCSEYVWSTARRMTYDDKAQLVKTEVVVP